MIFQGLLNIVSCLCHRRATTVCMFSNFGFLYILCLPRARHVLLSGVLFPLGPLGLPFRERAATLNIRFLKHRLLKKRISTYNSWKLIQRRQKQDCTINVDIQWTCGIVFQIPRWVDWTLFIFNNHLDISQFNRSHLYIDPTCLRSQLRVFYNNT